MSMILAVTTLKVVSTCSQKDPDERTSHALKLESSVGNLELGVHLPAPVDVGQLVSCLVMTPDTAGWLGFSLTAAPP